jgi:hypothetical protein
MSNHEPNGIAPTGWLARVTSVQGGGERRFVAGFASEREAELEVRGQLEGRGKLILVERQLSTSEMMELRLKPGEIRPHA